MLLLHNIHPVFLYIYDTNNIHAWPSSTVVQALVNIALEKDKTKPSLPVVLQNWESDSEVWKLDLREATQKR